MEFVTTTHVRVPVAGWPSALDGLRIAHLTDLHLRKWNRVLAGAQRVLLGLDFDLLAVTGDLGHVPSDWERVADLARRFFKPIHSQHGTYAVLGNHDSPRLADCDDMGLQLLRDAHTDIRHNGATLAIAGVEQTDVTPGSPALALSRVDAHSPTLLLAHYPSTVFAVPRDRVGLVLAGHTHGGQIRLPLLGCVWAHDRIPNRMARGLHTVDGTRLHVSPGIGLSGPLPLRFCCPPEIAILTVRASEPRQNVDFGHETSVQTGELQKTAVAV